MTTTPSYDTAVSPTHRATPAPSATRTAIYVIAGLGWLGPLHRRNPALYLLSSSFYPVVMIAAMAGGVAVGDWETYDDWAPLRFAVIALVALVPYTFTAIAEEFGWRGFVALYNGALQFVY